MKGLLNKSFTLGGSTSLRRKLFTAWGFSLFVCAKIRTKAEGECLPSSVQSPHFFPLGSNFIQRLNILLLYISLSLPNKGPFLEGPGNLPGPISVLSDKCFLTEVNFVSFEY